MPSLSTTSCTMSSPNMSAMLQCSTLEGRTSHGVFPAQRVSSHLFPLSGRKVVQFGSFHEASRDSWTPKRSYLRYSLLMPIARQLDYPFKCRINLEKSDSYQAIQEICRILWVPKVFKTPHLIPILNRNLPSYL
jgi:hypothetical protein